MNLLQREEHTKLLKDAVEKVEKMGYEDLRVEGLEEFEAPKSFVRQKNEESFTPDITAKKGIRKAYFDIALKTENTRRLITKWRLIDTLSRMKNNKFILLIPRGSNSFVTEILKKYSISAVTVKI